MTEFKAGDRVHVEFDAKVVCPGASWETPPSDSSRWWVLADGAIYKNKVMQSHMTKIVEPVKLGDLVTAENIPRLPLGAVISSVHGYVYQKQTDGWFAAGSNEPVENPKYTLPTYSCKVIYLPPPAGGDW